MSESMILVKRMRVSYVATRIHAAVQVIRDPDSFCDCLVRPTQVNGLAVTLPWLDDGSKDAAVSKRFWSNVLEKSQLGPPLDRRQAEQLRRHTVPLRHQAQLLSAAALSRLEVLLHPFGWVVLGTVDLLSVNPLSPRRALASLATAEETPALAIVGDDEFRHNLGVLADDVADDLLDRLGDRNAGTWSLPPHRLVTIIDGQINPPPTVMPSADGPVRAWIHRLSRGGIALSDPRRSFVPRWSSGRDFGWAPTELVYSVGRGTAVLCCENLGDQRSLDTETNSERHRRFALSLAHVLASCGLVRAATESDDPFLTSWGSKAVDRLGRLFGPNRAARDYWGLEPRWLIRGVQADADVATLRGDALVARCEEPEYPPGATRP